MLCSVTHIATDFLHRCARNLIKAPEAHPRRRILFQICRNEIFTVVLVFDYASQGFWAVKAYPANDPDSVVQSNVNPDVQPGVRAWIEAELRALEKLQSDPHRLLTRLTAFNESEGFILLATPYIGVGTTLYHRVHHSHEETHQPFGASLPERHVRFYAAEIAVALDHLHDRGLLHCDINLSSVLVHVDGHIVLSSMRLAEERDDTATMAVSSSAPRGLLEYISPEMLCGHACNASLDFWGLGCAVFEMLTGYSPFGSPAASDAVIIRRILWGEVNCPPNVGVHARACIEKLLHKDPQARPARSAALQSLPFFDGFDIASVESMTGPWLPVAGHSLY